MLNLLKHAHTNAQCHKLNYGRRAECCKCRKAKGPDALYPPHLNDSGDDSGGGGGEAGGGGRVSY